MVRLPKVLFLCFLFTSLLAGLLPATAAKLQVLLPMNRTAYQTNEQIDISVVRSDAQALPAGVLTLTATGDDASKLTFTFPVQAVPVVGAEARATENLHLNGWLLRPGAYAIAAAADGAEAPPAKITVYSHIRRSTYRTIHWGGPRGEAMAPEGEDGMGFNIIMGGTEEPSIRTGEDIMGNCLMGGGHQHDLKLTNDWSDPNVYLGADQRGVDRAFAFRTMPNAIGAHLHDEPGLTWAYHPHMKDKDGKPVMNDHDIAPQRAAYLRAFGEEAIWADQTDTSKPEDLAKWEKMNEFKLGFMDAFWKSANQAISRLKPGFLAVTQSQYGWSAFYDGYYYNVARSLPVISGHGGYNDFGPRNFNPSCFLELALPRQLDKPTWYLPEWYNMTPDSFREEHNLSFITGIQGMSNPPGLTIDSAATEGITESNKNFARLGTIFTKPDYTRQDLAILYSKSDIYYNKANNQVGDLFTAYMATRLIQYPINTILDEDIIDGTVVANHKAVLITGLTHLDPAVIAGLEAFEKAGGVVLMTDDCTVKIDGAVKLGVMPNELQTKATAAQKAMPEGTKDEKDAKAAEGARINSFRFCMENAEPLAKALKAALIAHGIQPAFGSDIETLCAGKQVRGDIEYLLAVNYTPVPGYNVPAPGYGYGTPVPAAANLQLPADGKTVYDAMNGGIITGKNGLLPLRFGPGQMRIFARTARPIGGVQVGAPVVSRDLTETDNPLRVEFSATLVDNNKMTIAGTAPLQIDVIDPLGAVRYHLFRATDKGVCTLSLPLAANDPAGKWTVTVQDLLSKKTGSAAFTYQPAPQCGAVAGATHRATYFFADKENVYNFIRNQRNITIVKGSSDYDAAAADRLSAALKPYNITCNIVTAAEVNKARPISDEDLKTWCGNQAAGCDPASKDAAGFRNNPAIVGYNLPGPSILLGNAKDNPLIAFLDQRNVLPYKVTADFPGRGHGLVAWNFMTLGHDLETIALVANDADGLNEAVGTAFQLGVGLDTLTPLALPVSNSITPATQQADKLPVGKIDWQILLPDRVNSLKVDGNVVTAISADGTQATIDATGKAAMPMSIADVIPAMAAPVKNPNTLPKATLLADHRAKYTATANDLTATAFWGGALKIVDAAGNVKAQQTLPQDITAMAWAGNKLIVGLANGAVSELSF